MRVPSSHVAPTVVRQTGGFVQIDGNSQWGVGVSTQTSVVQLRPSLQ